MDLDLEVDFDPSAEDGAAADILPEDEGDGEEAAGEEVLDLSYLEGSDAETQERGSDTKLSTSCMYVQNFLRP